MKSHVSLSADIELINEVSNFRNSLSVPLSKNQTYLYLVKRGLEAENENPRLHTR